jgi:hypothetical protein
MVTSVSVKLHRIPPLVLAATTAILALTACASSGSNAHDQRVFGFSGTHLVSDDSSSDLQMVPGNGSVVRVSSGNGDGQYFAP